MSVKAAEDLCSPLLREVLRIRHRLTIASRPSLFQANFAHRSGHGRAATKRRVFAVDARHPAPVVQVGACTCESAWARLRILGVNTPIWLSGVWLGPRSVRYASIRRISKLEGLRRIRRWSGRLRVVSHLSECTVVWGSVKAAGGWKRAVGVGRVIGELGTWAWGSVESR